MIYPDEAMLYAPVEWHDCSEGFEDIRYEKSTDGIAKITINRPQVRLSLIHISEPTRP